jgi:hypothetical protein
VSRSAQKAAEQSAQQQQQQQMANQTADRASRDSAVAKYTSSVDSLTKSNPWLDPNYVKDYTSIAAGNSAGVGASTEEAARNYGLRTGTNSAVLSPALAEMDRERRRELQTDVADKRTQAQDKFVDLQKFATGALGQVPGIYNQGASTAVAGLGSANNLLGDAAKTPGFWDTILNSAVQGAAAGGTAAAAAGCVIAAACFGQYDLRTRLLRLWINNVYDKTRIGKHVVAAYRKYGARVAEVVKRHRVARALFTAVFNAVLPKAGRELHLIGGS